MATAEQRPSVGLMLATTAAPDSGRLDPARVVEAARMAEAAGFDGVYVGDHLIHPRPMLESLVTLAAVAAATERVALGPCVLLLALRPPAWARAQLATLAALAPGRLRIGVGVGGEYPAEFDAAGVPLAERGRRLEAAVREVRDAVDAPFLFAGWREAALRRAAALGDGWIGYLLDPDSFARRRDLLLGYRDGRGTFTTGMLLAVHTGGDAGEAARYWSGVTATPDPLPDRLFAAGTPDEVALQLHGYWERGIDEFVLSPADHGAGYLAEVERLATEVLPAVRGFSR